MADNPVIATDGSGFIAVWEQLDGLGKKRAYAAVRSGSTFGPSQQLSGTSQAFEPVIASNGVGFALTWVQFEDHAASASGRIESAVARLHDGAGWEADRVLLETSRGAVIESRVASNGSGYAFLWIQHEGDGSVGPEASTRRSVPPPVVPVMRLPGIPGAPT